MGTSLILQKLGLFVGGILCNYRVYDSVLMKYDPHKGISKKYKLTGFGDFNGHLKVLYEITDNEVFKETIDLPKAE